MGPFFFTERMMVCLQLLLSLARAAPTPVNDQVPVSDASSSGPVNYESLRPLPGFTPGFHGEYTGYGGQQPGPGGYAAQQPGPGGYAAQQPGPGGYGGQQPGPGGYGGQQPVNGGQPGYGNPGYGSGPMSAPQFCLPYGGFGPFVGGPGGYYGRPYGGFDPFGDYEDMFDDQNADDYLADLYGADPYDLFGVDQEDDEHFKSTSARLEKYLQKQWQLGKRKLQVQVDFGNVPLEWEYLNQYHGVRHPLAMTAFGPKYGLAGPPPPMYDYGYSPVQQGGLPMPSPFFGQQAPGSWQQQQFGPAPVQHSEAPVQGEETVQQPATSR